MEVANIMAYREIDEFIKEFDSLQDLLDTYDGFIHNILVNDQATKSFYTKQNGYRILSVVLNKDYPTFNPDAEGIYLPIATFASTRFKDTKSISTPMFNLDQTISQYERDWIVNNMISFHDLQVYIGNGYINIIVNDAALFDICDSVVIVVVMDMMYDKRKQGLTHLLNIIDD